MNDSRIPGTNQLDHPDFQFDFYSIEVPLPHVLIIHDNQDIHEDFRLALGSDSRNFRQTAEEHFVPVPLNARPDQTVFELEHALSGIEGIDIVKKALASGYPFQLAFVDFRMQEADDEAILERLWEIDPSIQIVLLATDADFSAGDFRVRFGRIDNLLLLKKPFKSVEVALITGMLTRKWLLDRQASLRFHQVECLISQRMGRAMQPQCEESQFCPVPRRLVVKPGENLATRRFSSCILRAGMNSQRQSLWKIQKQSQENVPLQQPKTHSNQADARFLRRAMDAVEKHMSDFEFDVKALSRLLFISRRQLLRRLKRVAGCSPNTLIRKLRLKKAAELLKSSGLNVSEITYAVGFSDLKHFREVFRQEYGIAPSQFARETEEKKIRSH